MNEIQYATIFLHDTNQQVPQSNCVRYCSVEMRFQIQGNLSTRFPQSQFCFVAICLFIHNCIDKKYTAWGHTQLSIDVHSTSGRWPIQQTVYSCKSVSHFEKWIKGAIISKMWVNAIFLFLATFLFIFFTVSSLKLALSPLSGLLASSLISSTPRMR